MPDPASRKAANSPACPICGKPATAEMRPFCSKRCADVDLGRWLGGRYAIPGEPASGGALGGAGEESDEGDHG